MTHGSLFSGIGGFDLAAEWMGWENMFHCEWNEFGQKILKHYWPKAKLYGNIKEADFTEWRGKVDIVSGGFPCQPYSVAGKRKGKEDERHLWPEMLRAIMEIQPRWVVGENVFGLINWSKGLVFHEVQTDLEAAGYEVWPYVLPACGVNAPHRRDRIWFVAYNNNRNGTEIRFQARRQEYVDRTEGTGTTPNPTKANSGVLLQTRTRWNGASGMGDDGNAADTERLGQSRPGWTEGQGDTEAFRNWKTSWADPNGQWPTQPPVCGRDDGISGGLDGITVSKHRKESLMAYGNAVVPQVVYQIFKTIEQYDSDS